MTRPFSQTKYVTAGQLVIYAAGLGVLLIIAAAATWWPL